MKKVPQFESSVQINVTTIRNIKIMFCIINSQKFKINGFNVFRRLIEWRT